MIRAIQDLAAAVRDLVVVVNAHTIAIRKLKEEMKQLKDHKS